MTSASLLATSFTVAPEDWPGWLSIDGPPEETLARLSEFEPGIPPTESEVDWLRTLLRRWRESSETGYDEYSYTPLDRRDFRTCRALWSEWFAPSDNPEPNVKDRFVIIREAAAP